MTSGTQSAVTPERFAKAITFADWMVAIQRNREEFDFNYERTFISPDDEAVFKELGLHDGGPSKVLVLGEDWCPDVYRGLPVAQRVAEAGGYELRILFRDQNLDIMNEFLNQGEFQSIPTVVFYTDDLRYICHWTERPQKANDEMHLMRKITEGRTREEYRDEYKAFIRGPVWGSWRDATVAEIRDLLTKTVQRDF